MTLKQFCDRTVRLRSTFLCEVLSLNIATLSQPHCPSHVEMANSGRLRDYTDLMAKRVAVFIEQSQPLWYANSEVIHNDPT
jgi:hypothetical protein